MENKRYSENWYKMSYENPQSAFDYASERLGAVAGLHWVLSHCADMLEGKPEDHKKRRIFIETPDGYTITFSINKLEITRRLPDAYVGVKQSVIFDIQEENKSLREALRQIWLSPVFKSFFLPNKFL